MLSQLTLIEAIVLLISNLDKVIVRTNTFSYCLLIASFFCFNLSFVITISINTLKILLTSYIKIINIVNLSRAFSNNSSNYCDLLKLSYSLINNFCFLKKARSIRRIKISN